MPTLSLHLLPCSPLISFELTASFRSTMASAYSPDQLSQFLNYISIPSKYHLASNPQRDLAYLTALVTHTLSAIPYENLSLHYSPDHTISLEPQHLFRKIVGNARGRGGYCMENSLFFNQVLKGLGFDAYPVGVRIRHRVDGVPQGEYIGWFEALLLPHCDCSS